MSESITILADCAGFRAGDTVDVKPELAARLIERGKAKKAPVAKAKPEPTPEPEPVAEKKSKKKATKKKKAAKKK